MLYSRTRREEETVKGEVVTSLASLFCGPMPSSLSAHLA